MRWIDRMEFMIVDTLENTGEEGAKLMLAILADYARRVNPAAGCILAITLVGWELDDLDSLHRVAHIINDTKGWIERAKKELGLRTTKPAQDPNQANNN